MEIKFVDDNILSHKKYHYVFNNYSDYYKILVDDDLFYRLNMVEDLYNASILNHNFIISQYTREINFINQKIEPYKFWKFSNQYTNSSNLFIGTGGGVLFPPNFKLGIFNDPSLFMKYTKYADDIWLNAVIKFFNYKILRFSYQPSLLSIIILNNYNLSNYNYNENGNDIQIDNVRRFFMDNYNFDPFTNFNSK